MISLIIPFYNCEKTVLDTLKKVIDFKNNYKENIEIIIVNDGSTDNTGKILEKYNNDCIKYISYEQNRGKGGAIKEGVRNSKGEKIIFTDADLAYGLSPLSDISDALDSYMIAIGNRRGDKSIAQKYGNIRNIASNIFSLIIENFLHLGIADTQCGFKGYRKEIAEELFEDLSTNGFAFDLEILAMAKCKNYTVAQVPVSLLSNEKNSKVNVVKDGAKMLFEVKKIKKKIKKYL